MLKNGNGQRAWDKDLFERQLPGGVFAALTVRV
jgi:hypothetical protein